MMSWTRKDIEKLKLGNNLHDNPQKNTVLDSKYVVNGKISIEKEAIKKLLWWYKRQGLIKDYVEELQFHEVRMFRFDWAIPDMMLAIEYEGLMSRKSGHTTISGYTKDCEKYNLAQLEGWKVLRYTALNYTDLEKDLKLLLKK